MVTVALRGVAKESGEGRSCRLLVLAKEPRAGAVKTRLCPPFSPAEAAELALAALADTLAAVRAAVIYARSRGRFLDAVLVLEGRPGSWLDDLGAAVPDGLRVIAQRRGSFDRRIAGAFDDAIAGSAGLHALLIGMDTPQVSAQMLVDAAAALDGPGVGAVLGLAEDGGWWGMGLRQADPSLILGVLTSTTRTGRDQHRRLTQAGLRVHLLPPLRDVDTAADAAHVASLVPGSRFASTLAGFRRFS